MKILKTILIVIGILIAIPLIVGLFVDKNYVVEREIVINRPVNEVYDYIKYLKNQDNFSKWAKLDPAMTKTYSGTDGTVGFVSAWKSNHEDVGTGEQEITAMRENEGVEMELRFKEPFESNANAYMKTEGMAADQTKVRWGFSGSMPYPMNSMRLVMDFDEMIGNDLNIGLTNLKSILE